MSRMIAFTRALHRTAVRSSTTSMGRPAQSQQQHHRLFSSVVRSTSSSSSAWLRGGICSAAVASIVGVSAASFAEAKPEAEGSAADLSPSAQAGIRGRDNVVVLQSKAIDRLMTYVRNKNTTDADFAYYADRLMRILAEEALGHMKHSRTEMIETPCGPYRGLVSPPCDKICLVSIMRSGDILTDALRAIAPGVAVGKILVQRDESDDLKRPKLFYAKLPHDVTSRQIIICDPMLATGGSVCMCIKVLLEAGVKEENILFLNVVSAPEGIKVLCETYPQVKMVTAAIDEKLNDDKFIVPGLGDFGDRYYRTR